MIRYLKRPEVDATKWNACIEAATNGLIYAYTFYLDALCATWDALVLDDYTAVMPLPYRKKWGVAYLYQPFAVAQLGLFGNGLSTEMLHGFLKKIPGTFRYWDFPLNWGNNVHVPGFPLHLRKNFVLPLHQPYGVLKKLYRPHVARNIKKAEAVPCIVQKNSEVDAVLALAKTHKAAWGTATDYRNFKHLYALLSKTGNAFTYMVQSGNGTVLASAVFFRARDRAYYILPGNAKEGKKVGASHLLIDAFIRDHAGQNLVLDFEGSDVPGLQFFYSSFGAVEENYTAIRLNNLPPLLRWLKP